MGARDMQMDVTQSLVVTLHHRWWHGLWLSHRVICLEVVLLNESGVPLAEGHLHDCVDQNLLGNEDVGLVIHESLVYSEVYLTQRFLLHSWPLRNVMLKGVSLRDHEWRHMQIQEEFQANMMPRKSLWKYDSLACVPHTTNECKCQKLHTK